MIAVIALLITLILAMIAGTWKLATYIRDVEKSITNDTHHQLERIEYKIDNIFDDTTNIKERIARLETFHEE